MSLNLQVVGYLNPVTIPSGTPSVINTAAKNNYNSPSPTPFSSPNTSSASTTNIISCGQSSQSPGTTHTNSTDITLPENNFVCHHLLKDRYSLCLSFSSSCHSKEINTSTTTTTPSSRNFIDFTSSNLKCFDIKTKKNFLCKIINEPLEKVRLAYFNLLQDSEKCKSEIYGHNLIRRVHDIVTLSKNRTYVIIPEGSSNSDLVNNCPVYEDLHTYIRNKRRLSEIEARGLFHQISQTVQVCHRNGIILRDLKLKRFYFVDADRTKLEYESLEGSMILDNPNDDLLSDKIGCPLYTAPELLCPHPTYNGKPADMWSLGVILYTMLVGQYPFYEKNNCNLIGIIRHCQVMIPCTLSKSVCFLLRSLLRKNHLERVLAEDIFYDPWLKEQKPYYSCAGVDVQFSESDNEDDAQSMTDESEFS